MSKICLTWFLGGAFLFSVPKVHSASSESPLKSCKDCNLIVISLTSARARNMSMYGYQRDTTPHLTKYFKNAFIFKNAFAPATLTSTDAVSLFFSLSPSIHKTFNRRRKEDNTDILAKYRALGEILTKNGYQTAAIVSDEDYAYDWGFGRTFKYYFDRSYYAENGINFKPFTYSVGTKQLVPIAIKWLKTHQKEKKFLFLQGYDMHCPYAPEGDFAKLYQSPHSASIPFTTECFMTKDKIKTVKMGNETKYILKSFFTYLEREIKKYFFSKADIEYLKSRYDAEFNQADSNLQPFLDQLKELNLEKNSIIVFLSEHGDYLGENGYFMKPASSAEGNLHNANLNFPLAIKFPGVESKKKFHEQLIHTIDIAPTFLDLLGIAPDKKMQGKSFKNSFNTESEINDYVYGYSVRNNFSETDRTVPSYVELESLQNHEWKLNYSKESKLPKRSLLEEKYFLYNLLKDPNEQRNLAKSNPIVLKKLKDILNIKRSFYSK